MSHNYVPYETLSRVEASEIIAHLPTALGELSAEQLVAIHELVADGYARGLDAGFAMSDFAGPNPGTVMDAYNAGIAEGSRGE